MKKQLALFLMLVCVCGISLAAETVDHFIETEMQKQKIPGVALAVLRNGVVVQIKGYGMANVEHQVPVKPETIFQSGSLGKQFTSAAVMSLVEAGKIRLEDTVPKYFPDSPESWKKITVRHLLTHTSGILDYSEKDINYRQDYTEADLLKVLQSLPLEFQPGEKWNYSNSGYMLLGFVIHKVSGKFYGDVLQERIFRPLGMTTARVISEADIIPNRAAGYELNSNGELKNQEWVAPSLNTTADGALYWSMLDLTKWEQGLHAGKVLSKASWQQIWTPVTLNSGATYPYGFAWRLLYQRGYRLIEHSGHWQGFSTALCRYVDFGLTVIVMANLSDVDSLDFAHSVAGLIQPEVLASRFLKAEQSPERVAEFKKALAEPAALSTEGFAATLDESYTKNLHELQGKISAVEFRGCDAVAEKKIELHGSPVDRFCYFTTTDPQGVKHFTVAFTADRKVADLSYVSE